MPALQGEEMPENTHQGIHVFGSESKAPFHRRLEGKVVIVTGGAQGIGEAIVRLFTNHGAKVVIADIADEAGESLAASLAPSVTFTHCDVSKEPDIQHLFAQTLARHARLDILCNNAGVLGRQSRKPSGGADITSITNLDVGEFDQVMRVNVLGAALAMKHAARTMVPRRSGCIVSVASVASVAGGLGPHAYTASKHALVGLTVNAACELGTHGVRVNCVSPFGVATRMLVDAWRDDDNQKGVGDGGLGLGPTEEEVEKMEGVMRGMASLKGVTLTARDVAEAVLYLVSDEAKYVSGHNLVVDGGITTSRNLIGL